MDTAKGWGLMSLPHTRGGRDGNSVWREVLRSEVVGFTLRLWGLSSVDNVPLKLSKSQLPEMPQIEPVEVTCQ